MKKIIYSIFAFTLWMTSANAAVVVSGTAQAVAANFYGQTTQKQISAIKLTHTELSETGEPVYYVFDINGSEGFVIVSAEDAGRPIIGYSTEGSYQVPSETFNAELNYWMNGRKSEIQAIRANNIQADLAVSREWTNYITNKVQNTNKSTATGPLVQSKWNQSGGGSISYNNLCPGGSVTGCVATTMSQIMRYWEYPAKGTGSHSYNAGSYGVLSANYGTATYNWQNMPFTSSNADVAKINYHCGVSVEMNYSPTASGAQVCGNPAAEYSYKTYFKYDPGLHCVYKGSYSTATWISMMEAELKAGRPIQYTGADASAGGHTWVCDGNDASDKLHMNWGWGGASDGYFDVNSLTAGGFTFAQSNYALIGIKPLNPAIALDAATYGISAPKGTTCNPTFTPVVTIRNYGSSTLTSCNIVYSIDANPSQTFNWTGSLTPYQSATVTLTAITATVGSHTFTTSTSLPNGSADGNTTNDQAQTTINVISNTASQIASYSEGFENSGFPYSDCYVYSASGPQWGTTSTAASTGTNSLLLSVHGVTSGDGDEFITPSIDITSVTSPTMTFKLAHTQLYATENDQLQVLSSSNCGVSWVQRYSKYGPTLSTTGSVSSSAFTPTATQWRQETVSISSVAGMSDVRFKFKFNSNGAGNNIYIDDININSTNGVPEEFANGFDLSIFPNPMIDQTSISFNTKDKYQVTLGVYDIVGKEVLSISRNSELSAGSYTIPLNSSALSKGVYFIKLDVNGYAVTRKVVVQ